MVDISGSMEGKPLEGAKAALFGALTELDSKDSFNIIAFNGETYLFSSSMELATAETVERAIEWINLNFIAGGSTNILLPLNKVIYPLYGFLIFSKCIHYICIKTKWARVVACKYIQNKIDKRLAPC